MDKATNGLFQLNQLTFTQTTKEAKLTNVYFLQTRL